MNVRNLFLFVALMCLLPGVTMTFAPDFMAGHYLVNPASVNTTAKFLAQGWGTMLIAQAIVLWTVREIGPSPARRAIILMLLLQNIALIIIQTIAIMNGIETAFAWGQVLIAVVITLWSGMLLRHEERVTV